MLTLSRSDDSVRVKETAAGNVVNEFDFPIDPDLFDETLRTVLLDATNAQTEVAIPGALFSVAVLSDGIRFSVNEARRPQRLTAKIDWRDVCRYLVTR